MLWQNLLFTEGDKHAKKTFFINNNSTFLHTCALFYAAISAIAPIETLSMASYINKN